MDDRVTMGLSQKSVELNFIVSKSNLYNIFSSDKKMDYISDYIIVKKVLNHERSERIDKFFFAFIER